MIEVNPTDRLTFDLLIRQIDYNEQKTESLRRDISKKYGVPLKNVTVNVTYITDNDDGNSMSLAADTIRNIQDVEFQRKLFADYIKLSKIENVNIEDIYDIDKQINDFIDLDAYSKYRSYKFKYVKWSNYLSYGPDNYFDFTKLSGLVLLNGQPENQCGKTTFAIDLLRFALFGKAQKSPTLDSVFNIYLPEETEVVVEACIEIEGEDYVIRRTVTRPELNKRTKKSKSKQRLEYFKIVNGEYEIIDNCEAESTAATNNIIRETIGNVEDFNLVISATAYSLGDLLRLGQTDKGRLFSRWLGLLAIEKKEEVAKDMWKNNIKPKLLSNTYNKSELSENKEAISKQMEEYEEMMKKNTDIYDETTKKIEYFNKERKETMSMKKFVREEISSIDITTVENNIATEMEILTNKRASMRQLKEQYAQVKDVVFNEDENEKIKKDIEEHKENKKNVEIENAELKTKIYSLRDEKKRINDLIEKGICPTCGQEINVEKQTETINKIDSDIDKLSEKGINNKRRIDEIDKKVSVLNEKLDKSENDRKLSKTKSELELKMVAIKSNIDSIKLKITALEGTKSEIEQNKENVRYNNEIDRKIINIDESIKVEQSIKDNSIRQIERYNSDIKRCKEDISKIDSILEILTKEEKIIYNWTIYQELVGKNGIVKIVLRDALPVLNNEIARLLSGLCDFDVVIEISDDNKVSINMLRNGQKLDMGTCASGFETVMASMAVRHSLACIATMPKANFTVYDEILDGVAVSNYDNVKELFDRMVKSYDFILHITHNELISDWHNNIITVTKSEEGISKIEMR